MGALGIIIKILSLIILSFLIAFVIWQILTSSRATTQLLSRIQLCQNTFTQFIYNTPQKKRVLIDQQPHQNVQGMKNQNNYKIKTILETYQNTERIHFDIASVDKDNKQKQFFKNPKQAFNQFDILAEKNPKLLSLISNKIMSKTPNKRQKNQSDFIEAKLKQKLKKQNKQSINTVLLALKQTIKSFGGTLTFKNQSNIKTQLSIKALSTGFLSNQIKFTQTLNEDESKWNFNDIKEDKEKLNNFTEWYIGKISKEYNITKESIVILNIKKGSIQVQWTTHQSQNVIEINIKTKKLKQHPYFAHFQLSNEDFDKNGDIQFQETKNYVQKRGGWPYYQPVKCKRYGLNVSGKYDNGNDLWLKMNGQPGEWAVAFHGVSHPDSQSRDKKVMNSIMEGLNKGQMLKAGSGQAYADTYSINYPNQKVGRGIYCSPHFQVCLNGYSNPLKINDKSYRLIFQCRINPKKIKVCNLEQYWVLNDSKDIRPYGIILVEQQRVSEIPSPQKQFGEMFKYKKYKNEIQNR